MRIRFGGSSSRGKRHYGSEAAVGVVEGMVSEFAILMTLYTPGSSKSCVFPSVVLFLYVGFVNLTMENE